MYAKRISPGLDLKNGRVVKGTNFVGLRDAGDPVECAVEYDSQGTAPTRQGDPERDFTHFGRPESKRLFLEKDYCLVPALRDYLQESGLQPEKINLPYLPTPALRQEVGQRLEALGGLVLTSSIPDNIEVNAQSADKGSALRALAERLGIPLSFIHI